MRKPENKKNGKLGIWKCRADVQNVDMVYAQRHSKVSEWESPRVREWKVESEKMENWESGNAERISRMLIWYMLNGTPKSRNWAV